MRRVLVSDFDGTITKRDFFHIVIDELLSGDDILPWNEYLDKKISHFEALARIFAKIRLNNSEFEKFVLKIPIEECFIDTISYCHEHKIPFYIVSAGAAYYINLILNYLGVQDKVTLIGNHSIYVHGEGLKMLKPDDSSPFYSENYGVSKKSVVETLKNDYDQVIYAGDGLPDFKAAQIADTVFARGVLLDKCRQNHIKTQRFDTYCDILEYLKNG